MSPLNHRLGSRPVFALFLPALLLGLALGGCGDDDENPIKPPGNSDPAFPDTPQNALSLYISAYEARDTAGVAESYDSTYTGSSMDLNGGETTHFTLNEERSHVVALATANLSVSLDMGPPSTWARMPSDDPSHPEWAVISIGGAAFSLVISNQVDFYEVGGEAGTYQEFAFAPSLDSTSPTDTLWRIVRWREVGSSSWP